MVGLALVCFLLAGLFALMAAKPRETWRKTVAWKYRDPEANEPSDTAFALEAVTSGAAALFLAGAGVYLLTAGRAAEDEQRREEEAEVHCEEVVEELDDLYNGVGDLGPMEERAAELGLTVEVESVPVPVGTSNLPAPRIVKVLDDGELLGSWSSFGSVRDSCRDYG